VAGKAGSNAGGDAEDLQVAMELWDNRSSHGAEVLTHRCAISRAHVEDLRRSGISDATIRLCRFRSVMAKDAGGLLNWQNDGGQLGDCLYIPFLTPEGREYAFRLKPDKPLTHTKRSGKVTKRKYEQPKGVPVRPYFPPGFHPLIEDASVAILITEGEKKAARAVQDGFACVGLTGVTAWSVKRDRDADDKPIGPRRLLPDLLALPLRSRTVYVAFDSDAATKSEVQREEQALASALVAQGAAVKLVRIPPGPGDDKVGLDDFLVASGAEGLRLLMEQAEDPPGDAAYRFCALGSAEFFSSNYAARYMVERMLVEGQPGVAGGVKKGMKTSILIDLAVSLATATPFLSRFRVYRQTPVLFVSAESGEATIQATARRICSARGVVPSSLDGWCWWSFRLPQFGSVQQMGAFRQGLSSLPRSGGLAVLDPLYLALLAGLNPRDVQAGNLYQVGPLLLRVAQACLSARWTPLLAHHTTKHAEHEPLDLDDLAMAGIAEFSRQWLLLSRREAYQDGTGCHRLWLRAGGSIGHSSLWGVDIDEGDVEADDDTGAVRFDSRRWDVTVTPAAELIAGEQEGRAATRREGDARQVRDDCSRLLMALDKLVKTSRDPAAYWTETKVREAAGLSGARITRAVLALLEEGVIERGKAVTWGGKGNKVRREVEGIRRHQRMTGLTGLTGQNGVVRSETD
jgi:hypothetical protein